jgi:hypothetical protein
MPPHPSPRRRSVIRDPAVELTGDARLVTVTVEQHIRSDVSAVVEFASVNGGPPVVRQIIVTDDHVVPTADLVTGDLRRMDLDPLRDDATRAIQEYLARNPEWADVVTFGPDGTVARKRGRPRLDDTFYAVIARAYVQALADEHAGEHPKEGGRSREKAEPAGSIYRTIEDMLSTKGLHRSADRLRKDIVESRRRGLLTRATGTRAGGELTPQALRILEQHDAERAATP